jgi:succinyl-CoA synthetase beta subunit
VVRFRGDDTAGLYTTSRFIESNVLVLEPPDAGMRSIRLWADWSLDTGEEIEAPKSVSVVSARDALQRYAAEGRSVLLEHEATSVLARMDLPVLESAVVNDAAEAIEAADRIGYPVALKLLSSDVVHRAASGGLALNVQDRETVEAEVGRLSALLPESRRDGLLVQRMAPSGLEIIAGIHRDPVFGPVVLVGAGGVLTEGLRDVAFLLPPFSAAHAIRAINSLIISGQYEKFGVGDRERNELAEVLVALGALAEDSPDLIQSFDLNPVVLHGHGEGISVLDALCYLATDGDEGNGKG